MPPGAAGGDQQQRWRLLAARSLQDALSPHAVPASVRGSACALRATPCDAARQSGVQRAESTRRCARDAVRPRMYRCTFLHVHVSDMRKRVEHDTVSASSPCLCGAQIDEKVIIW